MKCTVELLADYRSAKTVSISIADSSPADKRKNSTQVCRLFVPDSVSESDVVVTVVVKGIDLPVQIIERLVADFLAKQPINAQPYALDIDELLLTAPQVRKSKMNSTLNSNPPRRI